MDPQKIKEYVLKMEGVSEGIKFGVNQAIQWMIEELRKEELKKDEVKEEKI